MPVNMTSFPAVYVVDGIISFLQYVFGLPGITDVDYRWNSDEKKSKIFIAGPYTFDREKLGSAPSITVSRGGLGFNNLVIDNLESAGANTFSSPKHRDIMGGRISVICESRSASEASGLASFCAYQIQSHRHEIISNIKFIQDLKYEGLSPENPIQEAAEIKRYQCVASFNCSLYSGWMKSISNLTKFNKANIYSVDDEDGVYNSTATITAGSPNIVDDNADFGLTNDNDPQLVESEYNNKWYLINFKDCNKKYVVEEIINNKTLRLSEVDKNGDTIPFNPESNDSVEYKLFWNSVHVDIEMPKKS
jgi:hypothetical protein